MANSRSYYLLILYLKGQKMYMLTYLHNGWQRLTETDHIVSDEEISAIERNKSEKNKNRKGADIPGLFIGSM